MGSDPRRGAGHSQVSRGGAGLPGSLARPEAHRHRQELAHLHSLRLPQEALEELRHGAGDDAAARDHPRFADRLVLDPEPRLSHSRPSRRIEGHRARASGPHHTQGCRKVPHPGRRQDPGLGAGRDYRVR